ncbi:hypothetical protein CHH28_10985 [Bacterioplanes sanyensis]|uniref:Leucine-rich repeat domain-containing protein n=1 Tax=Bacterioplanes sanyensis TaxID=1249553 RepID=A0A222FK62_9GAMM|nr:leucine-rich repeat domain-containing protein [Bacterioplanes sanyensis]ASP39170.1 hypothetical protein CHH28_10985 [Bacterioplanes sanyensis]
MTSLFAHSVLVSACLGALSGCFEQGSSGNDTASTPAKTQPAQPSNAEQSIDFTAFADINLATCLQAQGFKQVGQAQIVSCPQSDIRSLAGAEQLSFVRVMSVPHNDIQDLSPLASLTLLHTIDVDNNQINDLQPLQALTALNQVSAKHNQLRDINALTGSSLLRLYVDHNPLEDLSAVSSLRQLKHLSAKGHSAELPTLTASVTSFQL